MLKLPNFFTSSTSTVQQSVKQEEQTQSVSKQVQQHNRKHADNHAYLYSVISKESVDSWTGWEVLIDNVYLVRNLLTGEEQKINEHEFSILKSRNLIQP